MFLKLVNEYTGLLYSPLYFLLEDFILFKIQVRQTLMKEIKAKYLVCAKSERRIFKRLSLLWHGIKKWLRAQVLKTHYLGWNLSLTLNGHLTLKWSNLLYLSVPRVPHLQNESNTNIKDTLVVCAHFKFLKHFPGDRKCYICKCFSILFLKCL